jgi:phospho-N-acetylmuramoyl-pentapeptide-transferase
MEAGGVAFLLAVLTTPLFLRFLRRRSFGQRIHEDLSKTHRHKEGTPTMGGVVIIGATLVGYVMGHVGTAVTFTRAGVLVAAVTLAAGLLGLADDFVGIRNARNLGLNKRSKFVGQLVIGGFFSVLAVRWVHTATTLSFTRSSLPGWHLGGVLWGLMALFILVATSNAVNFTDGLDGLAAGSSAFCFIVLSIIGYWQFRHYSLYHLKPALDLALVAVALVGACLGFLWWNAAPAKIIMGDTGSLAVGTALAALCLLMNLDLLLVVIGGLFVVEAASVVLQIISFRLFHRRVFKMAPIHHSFELRRWPETTIIIRFWILAGLLAALGLGIFYADFLRIGRVV